MPISPSQPQEAVATSIEYLVPKKDDPTTSAFTFRAVLIGTLFALGLSIATSVWAFRTNASISTSGATFAVVASYPLGLLAHKVLRPHWFWNPGPFSIKEHVLIFIMTHACSVPYGMENVVSQTMPTLMGNQNITFLAALSFVFVTQFTGFGFAGLCRRFLVKPSAMVWPGNVSILAILISFHNLQHSISEISETKEQGLISDGAAIGLDEMETRPNSVADGVANQDLGHSDNREAWNLVDERKEASSGNESISTTPASANVVVEETEVTTATKASKKAVFWYSFLAMFTYTHVPEFLLPGLQTISICSPSSYTNLNSGYMGTFNAISSTTNGVGLFGLSFDWYYVQSVSPITTPFWALFCSRFGNIVVAWIAVVLLYRNDVWGLNSKLSEDSLNPILNSLHLFSGNPNSRTHSLGTKVDPTFFYDATNNYNLNLTAYNDVQPLHITSYFAIQYGASFLTISAVVSHVCLWYGSSVLRQLRNALRQEKDHVDSLDVHNQIMDAYWDPPDWMFLVFTCGMVGLTFVVSLVTPFEIPWWGVVLNLVLTGLLIVPIGIIAGISGITIGISVLAEFLMGTLIPGKTVAVMAFKSLALNNLNQGLTLIAGLKLGHYIHVPPMSVIFCQFLGTAINCISATAVTWWMMFSSGDLLNAHHGSWQYVVYQSFYSDGAIWGAIGPTRFFGVGSTYESLLWCFLVGFLCPFGPWIMDRYVYKSPYWHYFNFPVIFAFSGVGGYQNQVITPLIVAFIFQVILFRFCRKWYLNYAFVTGSGFDVGCGIAILSTAILGMSGLRLPYNPLNPNQNNVPVDYYCYAGANYSDFDCHYYSAVNASDPRAKC